MDTMEALAEHEEAWDSFTVGSRRGWLARPDDVVRALETGGFQPYRRDVLRSGRGHEPLGGFWQGVHHGTGSVASAMWVSWTPDRALLFLDVDGDAITDADGMGDCGSVHSKAA